jgi:dihydroneopterin aldolase
LDKIFVSDFLKEIEIGAFQSERGCTQRVRFNVSLDIKPSSIQIDDNVDNVLSYEIITDAINLELSKQRFNLLETLAERVADRCLRQARVIRAEVKIEKLDRIPGSLGVNIFRNKAPNKKNDAIECEELDTSDIALASFSGTMVDTQEMKSWLYALIESNKKITVLIEPPAHSFKKTANDTAMIQLALLGMEQDAWYISCLDERLAVVGTRSELYWAAQSKKVTFFCPSYFSKSSISTFPELLNNYDEFLVWFTKELGIDNLFLIGRDKNIVKNTLKKPNITFFNRTDWNDF